MKVGIIGFARSGKTTIFNALTGAHAAVGTFGTRDANIAVIRVPDERVDRLFEIYHPKKKSYAEVQFVDVAPNEAAGEAKALDTAALNILKNVEALVHVVRAFTNEDVLHPHKTVDPARDCRDMEAELQLSDLIILEKKLDRLGKEGLKGHEFELLSRCRKTVEDGRALRTLALTPLEEKDIAGYCFLSRKPLLLLANYGEESIGKPDPARLQEYAKQNDETLIELCGAMELEVARLPEEERQSFHEEMGLGEDSRIRFIHAVYDMLGLMSFLTVGEPEVHAWTVPKNTKAIDAAGAIHSDIQRGFIRAEVVNYRDFMAAGSMAKAREHGHVRLEGKEYMVQDGDIILFRFNV
ncbi:MAG: redox-regulated ATPase YchF [Candidatus Hydrogenedentes bacterium]|nr:redox-regulated ATPase YchF [Candidatus Hydrogenedentota bacterium]